MKRPPWSRRSFLQTGALPLVALAPAGAGDPASSNRVLEPARELPFAGCWDVLVAGGGPAGVAAAVSAARAGARTCLIEQHGCLGGIWTVGLLCWILDHANKPGLMAEILRELERRGARAVASDGRPTNGYDPEVMKLLLDELCLSSGVEIHLHSRVCAARCVGRDLTHAVIESRSGREAFAARVFVDATGDGDLAAQAGCSFDLGHPDTGRTQPMSLLALLTGLRPADIRAFYRDDHREAWAAPKDRLRAEMERGGHSPSYSQPTLFRLRDDLFAMMANHEYGVVGTNARDVTAATLRARREVHALVDGLRSLGGPWANVRIVATAAQIGIREGRRIRGRYVVTADDLRDGRRHADAVCRVTFGIDVHATDPGRGKGIESAPFRARAYDIPLRALIAADRDNLLTAGRCISGDFIAHSSYRVTGNAVRLGEAAGILAALAALHRSAPAEVPWDEIVRRLPAPPGSVS